VSDPDLIARILAVLHRWYPGDTFAVTPASGGVSTPVFRLEAHGQTHFIRLGEDPGDRRIGEITAHRHLRALGLPVPCVLNYEDDPPELDRSIALTSRIPGVPLLELSGAASTEDIGALAGETLASINSIPVRGYGWVTGVMDDGTLLAEHPDRAAWAAGYVHAADRIVAAGIFSSDLAAQLRSAIETWAHLPETAPAALAHGDFDSTHIYVDPETGKFTGIIDFGEIRGADRLYDLGHLLLHDGEAGRPRIWPHVLAGYSRVNPLPDDVIGRVRLQALAIGTRALEIQIARPVSRYREWLASRLRDLLVDHE